MKNSKRNPFTMTALFVAGALIPAFVIINPFRAAPLRPWGPVPSIGQLAYHKEELSAFIHFGMNTFTNKEWGSGKELPSQFTLDPAKLDTDQWVGVIKGAGFRRLIFVAKHHDGFCNWYTGLTQHSVKYAHPSSQVDVLERLSRSCTKANLNMGVYLSPWDVNSPYYGVIAPGQNEIDPWPYNNYYLGQLKEILDPDNKKYGNDGAFVEVWMDGARGKGFYQPYFFDKDFLKEAHALTTSSPAEVLTQKYLNYPDSLANLVLKTEETWLGVIKAFNQDIVVFSPVGTELRWPATESGRLAVPVWSKTEPKKQRALYIANEESESRTAQKYLAHGDPNGTAWSIPEADTSILASGWFENSSPNQLNNKQVKTLKELGDIYFESIGRGGVLLLNFAPNINGVLSDYQATRAKEFGEAIRNTFATNLASGAKAVSSSYRGKNKKFAPANVLDGNYDTYWTTDDGVETGSITIDLGQDKVFDVVSVQEYIPLGQRISQYKVEVFSNGLWEPFGNPDQQQTIGYKALVRNSAVTASKVRVTITASQAVPVVNSIGVYKTAVKDFEIMDDEAL
ncbi:MAG: alpha-L-fucosidase [Holophagales bacterium]|jgi:alpha-L-fucosidase|nr:alpha-L-fucosidase [Holophagales bacterium]